MNTPQIPSANLLVTPDAFLIILDMPGVSKETLDVSVENGVLTVKGTRNDKSIGEVIHGGLNRSAYERTFEIHTPIDLDKIQAKLEQGVVTLTLPKAESAKPKKITIT